MHIANPLSFDHVRIILAEVHETVTLTAIINEGISASLPVRLSLSALSWLNGCIG